MSCIWECYGHKCGKEFVNKDNLCEQHSSAKCWCGKQAYHGCNMELQFICGRPLCEEHKGYCPKHGGIKPKPICEHCGQELKDE